MAKGIGSACPLPPLPFTYVLYAPNSPFNLISISKLIHDLNCSIAFSHSSVTLQDRSTRKMIGIGHESQGLYHLSSAPSSTVCTSTDEPLLVHHRLGHPNISKLRKMVSRFSNLSSLECELCQLGKHTHVSFPKSLESRTKSNCSAWDPSRTASTLGFWYFVTFIDDFSHCTWLYLMKSRTELFSMFQNFFAKIHNQFHTSIRILSSDNALEYLSAPFSAFLSSHEILHQSSCAYTPQQNGVAERKNRHLVETTHTLLHHTVPQRLWGDAILTACYLINHIIKSLILFSFLINPFFISLNVFSTILVLSTYSLLAKINFLLRPQSASSLAILAFNAVTVATLPIHIDTLFPLMSPFLNTLLSSLPHRLLVPRSYLYLSSLPF